MGCDGGAADSGDGIPVGSAEGFVEEEEKKAEGTTKKYKCTVCGYVYEGEELPADYKCPICGMGADKFEEIQ